MGVEMMEKSEVITHRRSVQARSLDRLSPQNPDERHQLPRIPDPPRSKTSE